jgi:O-antigen ligase
LAAAYVLMEPKPVLNPNLQKLTGRLKIFFWGFFAMLALQIIPLPVFLIKIVSPATVTFREQFSVGAEGMSFMTLSLSPLQTFREGMEILAYVILGFLVLMTVNYGRRFRRLIYTMAGMGVFQALYGMFELYRENPRILFYTKDINLDVVTGTFVSQNHLTGYLEMVIPLTIGIILARMDIFAMTGKKLKDSLIHISSRGMAGNLILAAGVLVMAAGLILARSRSGAFSLGLIFILFTGISTLGFRKMEMARPPIKWALRLLIILIVVFALYAGIENTMQRFSLENLAQEQRPQFWSNTLEIFTDFPLFGTGLATFASVYPAYENFGIYGVLQHAHNDYLEYFSELGIAGMFFLFGGILYLAVFSILEWRKRRNPYIKALAAGGIIALAVIAVHSFTDFNLHIPANMILFAVILAMLPRIVEYRKRNEPAE